MVAYLLLLVAVLSRVIPHAPWWNFTAVTGTLLYFGARRPWREMLAPLAALITTDCFLTIFRYPDFKFRWQDYVFTWAWYLMAMALGQLLLGAKTTFVRGTAAAVVGPTSFFIVSNFGVWAGSGMYPHTFAGITACYLLAVPFYRNDLIATSLLLGVVLGIEVLVRRTNVSRTQEALVGK